MATFKGYVQKQRKDGPYQVYIRVVQNSKPGYIKTDKFVDAKGLDSTRHIKDPFVAKYCANKIADYAEKMNKVDSSVWSVNRVIEYLEGIDEDICFSDYARKHYARMFNAGQERNARNYELAYQHLEKFSGTSKLMFSRLTSLLSMRG